MARETGALSEDLGSARSEFPENIRWSLVDEARCGQRAYLRPCQGRDCSQIPDSAYPLAQVCETGREMVFVVDADEAWRNKLGGLVAALGFPVKGCGSAVELQESVSQYKSGCVLLDVKLPGQDGLAVQKWLNRSQHPLPVIFVSDIEDVSVVVECMKAGAHDFLQKPVGEMALRRAVSAAVGLSRKHYCRRESARLVERLLALLTPTELSVARMIATGYPTKLIAAEMGRSENTVKIHRHRIFSKLMVNSAASVANIMRHSEQSRRGSWPEDVDIGQGGASARGIGE